MQTALKTFMGPGSRRAGVTEERRALEEGLVVLRIQRHGEPVSADKPLWLHVGLMYIQECRPTFLRMFMHSADCQSSDATATLTAAQKPGEDHPWWLSDIEALDSLDFTAAWALDFWQVVSGLACGVADNTCVQAARSVQVKRMGSQTDLFWQGPVDLDEIEGDTSASGEDPENKMSRPPQRPPKKPLMNQQAKGEAHTAAPIIDSVPPIIDSMAPIIDSVPPIADGDVDAKPLEDRIKVTRGVRDMWSRPVMELCWRCCSLTARLAMPHHSADSRCVAITMRQKSDSTRQARPTHYHAAKRSGAWTEEARSTCSINSSGGSGRDHRTLTA